MDETQRIKVLSVTRDTPVSCPGGIVTILCKKAISPNPPLSVVKKRLKRVGFCDDDTIFVVQIATYKTSSSHPVLPTEVEIHL